MVRCAGGCGCPHLVRQVVIEGGGDGDRGGDDEDAVPRPLAPGSGPATEERVGFRGGATLFRESPQPIFSLK